MLKSPAKINLGLALTGRRDDGYHFLESVFWPLNFCDEITLHKSTHSQVIYEWADDSPYKTPLLLQNEKTLLGKLLNGELNWKPPHPYSIHVKKRIPIGAGLGGVSSNVGTFLRFLVGQGELTPTQAEQIAVRAGADVPFFLEPNPSWVTGIGEERTQIRLLPETKVQLFFLLVVFPFSIPTPLIFSKYREKGPAFSPKTVFDSSKSYGVHQLRDFLNGRGNDLEPIVRTEFSGVSQVLDCLALTSRFYSGLSGTGSTCFAAFFSPEERLKASKEINQICRSLLCKTVFAETF